jgi:hypothetical protein
MYATGTQQDADPKPVALSLQVPLNQAQWLTDSKSPTDAELLHAFRGYGKRCLEVTAGGGNVQVANCDSAIPPTQRFMVPVHGTGTPAMIQTTTGLCLAIG